MTHPENAQDRMRELRSLFDDYCAIAKNRELEPERRYALAMGESCMGRIKTLFKSLGMGFNLDLWGPQILGYDNCIDLAEEEIESRLKNLDRMHRQP